MNYEIAKKIRGEKIFYAREIKTSSDIFREQLSKVLVTTYKLDNNDSQSIVSSFIDEFLPNYNVYLMAAAIYIVFLNQLDGQYEEFERKCYSKVSEDRLINADLINCVFSEFRKDITQEKRLSEDEEIRTKYALYRYIKYVSRYF